MEHLNENFNLSELQEFCRKLKLPVAGLKEDVAKRILTNLTEIHSSIPDELLLPPQTPMTKSNRLAWIGTAVKRIAALRNKFDSSEIETSSEEATSSYPQPAFTFLAYGLKHANNRFVPLMQRFRQLIKKMPTLLGIVGGIFALFQIYTLFMEPHNMKLEISNPCRRTLSW